MEEKKQKLDKLVDDYMACRIQYAEFDKKIKALYDKEESKPTLKQFDLEDAKSGKPVCTRDGRKARIICFDRKGNSPIVALIERVDGIENLQCFYNDGKCFNDATSDIDLMMLTEKKEGWVNVYKDGDNNYRSTLYTNEKVALSRKGSACITTIKISWEE